MVAYNNSEIIEKIASQAGSDILLIKFIRSFYLHVPTEDLNSNDNTFYFNLAKKAFEFFSSMPSDEKVKLELYDEEGFTNIFVHHKDIPFLVDSVAGALNISEYNLSRVIHPVIFVKRDGSKIVDIDSENSVGSDFPQESLMYFRLCNQLSDEEKIKVKNLVESTLDCVKSAVLDWKPMLSKAEALSSITSEENKAFIKWIVNNNFTFLGYYVSNEADSSLGILKKNQDILKEVERENENFLKLEEPIVISKLKYISPVHRCVNLDFIGLNINNKVYSFIGLFTSGVYYQSVQNIPIIDSKIKEVLKKSGFKNATHNYKELVAIIEAFPRDELFHIDANTLYDTAINILALHERPRIKLFIHRTFSDIFISAITFIPRERFSDKICSQIQDILKENLGCAVDRDYLHFNESRLARYHLILRFDNRQIPSINTDDIEKKIVSIASFWDEDAKNEIIKAYSFSRGIKVFEQYKNAFPRAYQEFYGTTKLIDDIEKIEKSLIRKKPVYDLTVCKIEQNCFNLRIYSPYEKLSISSLMPVFDNIGFFTDDSSYFNINKADGSRILLHHFRLKSSKILADNFDIYKVNIEALLEQIQENIIKKDKFISLAVSASFSPRQILLTKAIAKYLKQIGISYHFGFLATILETHSAVVSKLYQLFELKFHPAKNENIRYNELEKEILDDLEKISDVTEDKILRYYLYFIKAVLRTNFYQADNNGKEKNYISFKIKSANIPEIPLPRPFVEVFVYSPTMEGIHLRGGKVARGGLRLSDRHDDYRTEVLGLMKTQMTKNSIIVPLGSKGGFIVKKAVMGLSREQIHNENIEAYKTFLRGILDVTDNVKDGKIISPMSVIKHDEDDPYLVVAADKGTATFSDVANSISAEYGFWLGDAFASGGSNGYDHKKIGITAKGGWVCVIRHFQEIGVDVFNEEFTSIGIGDMAGDVFGNFMLLSNKIKLIAAFNHMHIFIDPNPDASKSYEERKRLFNMPGSTWADYNKDLISKGGGVFERNSKNIELSSEIKQILDIEENTITPDALIRKILMSEVDLLWNGGIGTYVKAKEEHPEHVGDKNNDALRINGEDLRCKIVGEGGNLGFTQRGRIEYALKGGRINTDAIDNSAGVDCSDHEVNIKIAFTDLIRQGLVDIEGRNKILEEMTENVSNLVLADNKAQSLAISNEFAFSSDMVIEHTMLLNILEKEGILNRAIEYLPSDQEMEMRKNNKIGLTRPEIAVMLAYAKMSLFNKIIGSELLDTHHFNHYFIEYFPNQLVNLYGDKLLSHQLRKEIIATVITNKIINKCGVSFYHLTESETECNISAFIKAFEAAFKIFEIDTLWDKIDGLPFHKDLHKQKTELFSRLQLFIQLTTSWFIHNIENSSSIEEVIKNFSDVIVDVKNAIINDSDSRANDFYKKTMNELLELEVDHVIAAEIAILDAMSKCFTIIKYARKSSYKIAELLKMYFLIDEAIEGVWLKNKLNELDHHSYWDRSAVKSLSYEIDNIQLEICLKALSLNGGFIEEKFNSWVMSYEQSIQLYHDQIIFIKKSSIDISGFYVMAKRIKKLFDV